MELPSTETYKKRAKRKLLKKNFAHAIAKNFFLIIYLLYYRYTVEFGISVMTNTEAVIVNTILCLIFISLIIQGFKWIFDVIAFFFRILKKLWFIYKNYDEILLAMEKL